MNGCGKTTYLAEQVAEAVEKYGNDKVLVSSLTRAGARQAARQVNLPDSQVGTLHSIIYHEVGAPDIAEGHIKEWNETGYVKLKDTGASMDDPYGQPVDTDEGEKLKMEYARMRVMRAPRTIWTKEVTDFAEAWEDFKAQCGYTDFTDLLEMGLDLDTPPGNPTVMYLDEAQDFGQVEMDVLLRWARNLEELVVVGDSHQCLHFFRGSNPQLMHELGGTSRVLDQSYRVPVAVHRHAMRWMEYTGLPQVAYKPRNVEGIVRYGEGTYYDGDTVALQVREYVQQGKTVMVMGSCQYMLEPFLRALVERGMAYHNPWRPNNGRWNPIAPRRGTTFREKVLLFLLPDDELWGERSRFWNGRDLKAWAKDLPADGVFNRTGKAQLQRVPDAMPDTELVNKMREWFTPGALERIETLDVDWYMHAIKGDTVSKRLVRNIVEVHGPAALKEEPQIIVGTIHSLKGSEADVCFLWPDVSPSAHADGSREGREALARTFYVGVTRAREELVLLDSESGYRVSWR